jgi:4'-phosphopantetheinyl transferase
MIAARRAHLTKNLQERLWEPGPANPALAPGAVHVWRADLSSVGEALVELLSADERRRAETIVGESHRLLWARARGLLRALLGRYLHSDPQALRFAREAHGKPVLLEDRAGPSTNQARGARTESTSGPIGSGLAFNLSHSGTLALLALSAAGAVGVDVECARRPIDVVAVAARVFGQAEAERLRELHPADREQEFRRAWTRHEARLKCRGTGLGAGAAPATEQGSEPWLVALEMGPEAAGALAVESRPTDLRCWEWPTDGPTGS